MGKEDLLEAARKFATAVSIPLLALMGSVWVRRGEVDRKALEGAMNVLERGEVLGMAPEGTRARGIYALQKGKTGPVRVLDRLSQIIPKQVWLIEWLEKGSMVQVTGEALTMEDVGNFMRVLSTAEVSNVSAGKAGEEAAGAGGKKEKKPAGAKKYFTNIQLVSMEKAKEDKYNLNYVKFVLTMRVHYDI